MSSLAWEPLIPGVWRGTYTANMAIEANSYALRLRDGGIAIFSPPVRATDADFAATEALGPVVALVAPNSGHDLGHGEWQRRYPSAVPYAPEIAGPAIQKAKAREQLRPFQPLAALADHLPEGAQVIDVPGTRSGMTVWSYAAGTERVLFLDEVLGNSRELMGPALARWVFWLARSGPGLTRNRIWSTVFVKDRRIVARTLLAEWDARPPTMVVLSHGDVVRGEQLTAARRLLEQL